MSKPLRILIVEDSEDDVLLTIHALKKGGYDPAYERVEDAGAMRKALRNKPWDVILCDYQMPQFNGLAAIALLKETGIDIPLIMVSGAIGEETAVECMRLGAHDYVMKDNLSRLASAIDRELKEAESRRQRKHAEEMLGKSQSLLAETERVGKVGGWEFNIDTRKQTWTEEVYHIHELDLTFDPTVEKGIDFYTPASRPIIEQAVQRSLEHDEPFDLVLEIITAKGNLRSVHAIGKADPEHRRVYGFFQDITERRQMERRQFLATEVLGIINNAEPLAESISRILTAIKREMGFEAVGIRLREGDDFPYYVSKGFPDDFVLAERFLCARDPAGEIVRDTQGHPVLECMCGNILCGRTNPELPFFTVEGSFWSNCTTQLLATTTESDRQAHTRNRCNSEGYESVALIPLRAGGAIIGLLQLNDHRLNRFTAELIRFFEGLGASIGIALARVQQEEERRISEERFKAIFTEGPLGIALIDSMTGHICMANQMFAKIAGRTQEEMASIDWMSITHPEDVREILDNIRLLNAGTREHAQMQVRYLRPGGSPVWIKMTIAPLTVEDKLYPLHLSMIEDITGHKQAEETMRLSEENFRRSLDDSPLGVRIVSKEGESLYGNQALLDIFGYETIEEFRDFPITKHYTESSYADYQDRKGKRRLQKDTSSDYEIDIVRKDGELRHLQAWRKEVFWNGNKHYQVIYRDVTDRKRVEKQLHDTLESLRKSVGVTIQVIVSAVETRDPYTAGHQLRTADLARAIATEMGLPEEQINGIRIAGSIHDLGKLSIPAEILSKPTKLSEIEYSLITEHAQRGYAILKDVESSSPLAEIVYQHHERMDGSGYPRHLKKDGILLEARIMAVADVVEAMASHRPYRPALGIGAALEEISRNRGTLYDAKVTDACLKLFQEKGYSLN